MLSRNPSDNTNMPTEPVAPVPTSVSPEELCAPIIPDKDVNVAKTLSAMLGTDFSSILIYFSSSFNVIMLFLILFYQAQLENDKICHPLVCCTFHIAGPMPSRYLGFQQGILIVLRQ